MGWTDFHDSWYSASVVINMLYMQIAMTKSIPFSQKVPNGFQEIASTSLDEMSEEYVNLMMQKGLADAKAGRSCPVNSVFNDLRQKINDKQIRIQLTLRNLLKIN